MDIFACLSPQGGGGYEKREVTTGMGEECKERFGQIGRKGKDLWCWRREIGISDGRGKAAAVSRETNQTHSNTLILNIGNKDTGKNNITSVGYQENTTFE